MTFFTKARTALPLGVVFAAAMGFSVNAAAQTCTVDNWEGGATNLVDDDAGVQADGPDADTELDNRRYGGPCGLRVELDGTTPKYLADDTPGEGDLETSYIARFYVYLDEISATSPVVLFAAGDDTSASPTYSMAGTEIEVAYDEGSGGTLTLSVRDSSTGELEPLPAVTGVGGGWHSVELVWEQGNPANIIFNVDGGADVTDTIDTSGITIESAFLGVLSAPAGASGSVDFDDFDSRRVDRPGRLLVGDANNDGVISGGDNTAVLIERLGNTFAPGQPDCNEDGQITGGDNTCLLILRLGP
jgi:hypothetical protein